MIKTLIGVLVLVGLVGGAVIYAASARSTFFFDGHTAVPWQRTTLLIVGMLLGILILAAIFAFENGDSPPGDLSLGLLAQSNRCSAQMLSASQRVAKPG